MPLTIPRRAAVSVLLAATLAACVGDADPSPEGPPTSSPPVPTPTPEGSSTPVPTVDPTSSAVPATGGLVLALGDSVTFGVGVPDPSTQAFPALVAARLGGLEPRVLAVPGETAAGFLERRIDDVEVAVAELGDRVELVTIGLGANEILRIRRDPACIDDRASPDCQRVATDAAEEAAAALDAVVARVSEALAATNSDAPILLLAYYNPDVEPVAASTIVGADGVVACDPDDAAPGLNDRIACVAERRGTLLVDLYAAFLGREEELTGIGRGDVHPTVLGHEVIADAIVDQLQRDGG